VAGADLSSFLHDAVSTTRELSYDSALSWLGLRIKAPAAAGGAHLGAEVKNDGGRMVVSKVPRDTPAHACGLNVDDEIIAIDELRVKAGELGQRLQRYRAGDEVTLLVARRDAIERVTVRLGEPPRATIELELDPNATSEQVSRREAWLSGR
jgi:predicted metalloprotease with PDZ domain